MVVPHRLYLVALVLGLIAACPSFADAEDYRDNEKHFSLKISDDWTRVPSDALGRVNQELQRRMPGTTVHYQAGLQLKDRPPMTYPYILVQPQVTSIGNTTYDEIERSLGKELNKAVKKVESAVSDLGRNMAIGDVVLDRATNRIIMRTEMEVNNIGKIKGVSIGFIGSKGIIHLHCYAVESEFDRYYPAFQSIADSFHYDSGYEFAPRSSSSPFIGAAWGVLYGGIGGGLAGLLGVSVYLLLRMSMKPRNDKVALADSHLEKPEYQGETQQPSSYTIEVKRENDGNWIAAVVELPGLVAYGQTRQEAIDRALALATPGRVDAVQQSENGIQLGHKATRRERKAYEEET